MVNECPVCHHAIDVVRFLLKRPPWSCAGCASLLTPSPIRRHLARLPAVAAMLIVTGYGYEPVRAAWGPAAAAIGSLLVCIPVMLLVWLPVCVLLDRALVSTRRGFRCQNCSYDLRGQTQPRCPECGRVFSEVESAQMYVADPTTIVQRIAPRGRYVWWTLYLVLVVALLACVMTTLLMWRNATLRNAAPPVSMSTTPMAALSTTPTSAPPVTPTTAPADRLAWWREARFGMFIHWGPVSLKGTEIGWSRGGERRGYGSSGTEIPIDVYDNLYREFNPTAFDAREWVAIAKSAGMRYMVFTSRHHDGFSMFDTRADDYRITSPASPFGRDVVKELADACRAAGLPFGVYYSQPNWHHSDAFTPDRHDRYLEYLRTQVRELCTNYGPLAVFWFDGLGKPATSYDGEGLVRIIRELQPQALINNRTGLPEDFDTPEQAIGRFQIDRPWESCITICRQWAWKPDDELKSLRDCVQTLVNCAGADGNLLLNVGPMPTGQIEPRQVERLREIGAWLAEKGESIYGTRGGPLMPGPWGVSTRRGQRVYLHVLDWFADPLRVPDLGVPVTRCHLLSGPEIPLERTKDGYLIRLSALPPLPSGGEGGVRGEAAAPQASSHPANAKVRGGGSATPLPSGGEGGVRGESLDTIIVLELASPADRIKPIAWSSGSLTAGKPASASNVFGNQAEFGPDKAVDDQPGTRWATDYGVRSAWLEVDLGKETAFASVSIDEEIAFGQRVEAFELQYKSGDEWRTCLTGTRIGRGFRAELAPVKARCIRLHITAATEGPTIRELRLWSLHE
ncbi:MAG TPA: alpha-L-fucosidase [Phycisphaerae bacterium]|nr:alpha-L-fucosidase [Phycisphaerae bacterium]HNU46019.1 alpha-L-fucosidase [Phycisphaerae bacterium]